MLQASRGGPAVRISGVTISAGHMLWDRLLLGCWIPGKEPRGTLMFVIGLGELTSLSYAGVGGQDMLCLLLLALLRRHKL